ncbi:MAG: chemotaxis protein CheX [Pseudobdellovibrionaceae bacterium]
MSNIELIDKSIIEYYVAGAIEVLGSTCSLKVTSEKAKVNMSNDSYGEICGLIGFSSGNNAMSILITFTKPCILYVVEKMLGETHATINKDIADAVGEISNMIHGFAKTKLNEKGYQVSMALPTVIYGENLNLSKLKGTVSILVPLKDDKDNKFFIEFTIPQ